MYSVLYVDDEKSLLEIAQIFLQISGEFRVSIMTSAQKALDSPSIWSYDAIISDYQMPGMDGIAFLKAVRERFGDIPFILFTGRGREEVVIDAINNGADFYLQKGGDPESQFAELAHKIRQVVRRKRAERSLRDSERRLSDIIDFLPDATFAIDRSGQVIAWNRAIEEMTGIPADDMLGKGNYEYAMPFYGTRRPILIDLLNEPDETIAQYYSNIYRTGNSLTAQTDLPHPKGHRISVLVKVSLLYNPAGEVTGAIESVRDITNIKKAEEELRAANEQITADEEKLRSQYGELAESERTLRINEERLIMAQGIGHTGSWEYDPATNKIWGSAEGLHIFGYPPVAGDFPIAAIEACIPERERVHQALVDLITKGQDYNLVYAINPADGSASKIIHSVARLEKDAEGNPRRVTGVIHDITERKRVEEEIIFKNVILSTQQETSLDGILIVDENGRILNYNQKFAGIWGIPAELIVSGADEPVLQYVTGQLADPETFLARVRYLYDHKDEKSFEELLLKDGRILERFSAPMLGEKGKYFGRVWYFRNITERRQAEDALKASEEKFRRMFDQSPVGAAIVSPDFRFQQVNGTLCRILGYTEEELRFRTFADITHPDHLPMDRENIKRLAAGEIPEYSTEKRYIRKDGRIVWAETSVRPVKDASGQVLFFLPIVIDITGRREAELNLRAAYDKLASAEEKLRFQFEELRQGHERLHASESRLKRAEMVTHLGHWEIHLDTGKMFASAGAGAIYGVNVLDLPLAEIQKIPLPEYRQVLDAALDALITQGRPYDLEFKIRRADDGSLREIHSIATYDPEQRVVFGVIHDITDYKLVEEALRESEEKYRTLVETSFDGILIHQDGSIVYANATSLRLLGARSGDEIVGRPVISFVHPEYRALVLQRMTSAIGEALPVIREKFFRIDGSIIDVDVAARPFTWKARPAVHVVFRDITESKRVEEIGVNAPVWQNCRTLLDTASTQVSFENITMKNDLPAETEVFADPMIVKVFSNLMDNAVRYGGKITTIRFFVQESGNSHLILCEDDGEGIPADQKEQVFEQGFGRNTGLGLFLAREILGITGITIQETGEPGKGARFEMVVPKGVYRFTDQ
jgi:PAS domain S-box-containing protein